MKLILSGFFSFVFSCIYAQFTTTGSVTYTTNKVGIGTSDPQSKLHLAGSNSIPTEFRVQGANRSSNWYSYFGSNGSNPDASVKIRLLEEEVSGLAEGLVLATENYNGKARYSFGTKDNTPVLFFTQGVERFRITEVGNIGIGTTDTRGYRFAVNGDAVFTKIIVKQYQSWPDYVFDSSYKLLSLNKLDSFIAKNKHLPGMASASEVAAKGIDVAATQEALLKNLEELTLQVIQQNKALQQQQQTIDQLLRKLNLLEGKMNEDDNPDKK